MLDLALEILNIIHDNNHEAYIVGGFVRDNYIGNSSLDVDICTDATPMKLKEIFKSLDVSNEEYGNVTLSYKKTRFEITTFREDFNYIDNRFPSKIKYVKDLRIDLKRRDFTINTICINKYGEYVDYFNGIADIENRIIKSVGDSDLKIKEDALRILRAIRFATTLDFKLDESLKMSIIKYKSNLKTLSVYRRKQELDKIFMSKNKKIGIDLINELELANELKIDLSNFVLTESPLSIWAQITDDYGFNKNEKDIINKIKDIIKINFLNNEVLYKYGLYVCELAAEILKKSKKDVAQVYMNLPIKSAKDVEMTVLEISDTLKIEKSEAKQIFKKIEMLILNNKLKNNKDIISNYIRRLK